MDPQWHVLVPVKDLGRAKTRLSKSPDHRRRLAAAMALDTMMALAACAQVARMWVVTSDPDVRTEVSGLGLPPGQQPTIIEEGARSSLNLALEVGLSAIAQESTGPTAIVAADLPAASADDFDRVLTAALGVLQGAVPDAQEEGTTLLSATSLDALSPQFGDGSLTRHLAHGAVPLEANARLRLDVDTPADLRRAVALGVGRHTMRCLLALRRAATE